MDGPYHVTGKRSAETPDWRIKEAINARNEKHLKNNRGKGVIVQSEVDAPDPPLPSPPLPKMSKPLELPDKYKTLNNLFAGMECSIRWLALQNQLPTFQNICTQMERQTKKKFLISHLAQMKHVFPEAIDLDTVLVHDKRTLCMKPEMKVTLLMNAETCSMFPAHSPSQSLWKAFYAKLLKLSLISPEGGEIPEALLPDPFNRGSHIGPYNVLLGEPPAEVSRQFPHKVNVSEKQVKSSFEADCASGVGKIFQLSDEEHDSSAEEPMAENPVLTPKIPIPTSHEKLVIKDAKSPPETLLTPSFSRSSVFSRLKTDKSVPDPVHCAIEKKMFWEKDISNYPLSILAAVLEEMHGERNFLNRPPSAASDANSDDRGPRFNGEFLN